MGANDLGAGVMKAGGSMGGGSMGGGSQPGRSPQAEADRLARLEREAEALRANLRRRKEQGRGRTSAGDGKIRSLETDSGLEQ